MKKTKEPIITLSTRDCYDYKEMETYIEENYSETLNEYEKEKLLYDMISDVVDVEYNNMVEELDNFINTHGNLFLHITDYGLWYGSVNKAGIHLFHDATSFFKRLSKDIRDIDMEIYKDKVIVKCHHHDGTNYHELIPASKLTKKELLEWGEKIFNEDQYKEMKEIKNKQGLINFLEYNLPWEYVYN